METIPIGSDLDFSSLENLLKEKVDPQVYEWDSRGYFPREIFTALHDLGFMHHGFPRELGGNDGPAIDLVSIARVIGAHSPGIGSGWVANHLSLTAIARYARPEVARRFFGEIRESKSLTSFCATEKEVGTDLFGTRTTARKVAGGYVLSGAKHFITNINHSTHIAVIAQIAPAPERPLLSVFCLRKDSPGVRVGEPLRMLGQRESNTGQVQFEEVFVPEEQLLGKEGDAGKIIATCLSRTRSFLGALAVGICDRSECEALDYLQETVRYGEPLLMRKDLMKVVSGLRVETEAAWLLICRAGAVWDRRGVAMVEASAAKLFAGDLAVRCASEMLELTGAHGYLDHSILAKFHRDAKVIEIYEGASMVQLSLIERELYGERIRACTGKATVRRAA